MKPVIPEPVAEHEPTYRLDERLAEIRAEYDAQHGEGAWQRRVNAEWDASE